MKIAENVYRIDCTKGAYCYCIKENNCATLIDTGMPWQSKEIMNELKTYGISPEQVKRIILTHGDVDHIGNVNKIREATKCEVCADSLEIPYLEKQKKYNRIKGFLKALLHIGKVLNVKPFVDNKIGNIEIIKTPGHTPGHVCFKFGKIVFLGDLVGEKNEQLFTLKEKMTFDKTQLLDSIKNMNFSDVDLLCPAHGNIINTFPAWNELLEKINK